MSTKIDPTTKKHWVRVLPDLPDYLPPLREVDKPWEKELPQPPAAINHRQRQAGADSQYDSYMSSHLPPGVKFLSSSSGAAPGGRLPPGGKVPTGNADEESRSGEVSNFFGTVKIRGLDSATFDSFVGSMEKTLVMFYHPDKSDNFGPGREFAIAATRPQSANHVFAAVDCSVDSKLCCREQACPIPMFKVYAHGVEVNSVKDAVGVTADQIDMLARVTSFSNESRPKNGKRKMG